MWYNTDYKKSLACQNITRGIEIKNKLTVTRGRGGNGGKKGKGHQGTCIKDPWTKPKGEGLRVGGGGRAGSGGGKMETTVLQQQLKRKEKKTPACPYYVL